MAHDVLWVCSFSPFQLEHSNAEFVRHIHFLLPLLLHTHLKAVICPTETLVVEEATRPLCKSRRIVATIESRSHFGLVARCVDVSGEIGTTRWLSSPPRRLGLILP